MADKLSGTQFRTSISPVHRFTSSPLYSPCRAQLEALAPNTTALQESHTTDKIRGIMLTIPAPADSGYDFFSRCQCCALSCCADAGWIQPPLPGLLDLHL
jgi:hypothetical protein